MAEDWLRSTLDQARRGVLPGSVRTGATFADAAAEWLRYVEHDRDVKPSTLTDYRSVVARLLPAFGSLAVEDLTPRRIEEWRAGLGVGRAAPLTNPTRNKSLTILGGIMKRARKFYGLPSNPVRDVEKLRVGGGDLLVAEAEGDHGDVVAGEEQAHRGGVPVMENSP